MKYYIIAFATDFKLLSDNTITQISTNTPVEVVDGMVQIIPTSDKGKKIKTGVLATVPLQALIDLANTEVEGKTGWVASVEKVANPETVAKNKRRRELRTIIETCAANLCEFEAGTPEFETAKNTMKAAKAELEAMPMSTDKKPKAEKTSHVKTAEEIASEGNIEILKNAIQIAKDAYSAAIEAHNATEGWLKIGSKSTGERAIGESVDFETVQAIRKYASEHPELFGVKLAEALVAEGICAVQLATSRLQRYLDYRQHLVSKTDTMYIPFNDKYFNRYSDEKLEDVVGLKEAAANQKGDTDTQKMQNAWYSLKPTA